MSGTIAIAFFLVSLCVAVPMLYYYARRNPNPRFRPKFGEMVLMSIFAFGACVGAAIFMSMLLGVDPDFEKMTKPPERGGGSRPSSTPGPETPAFPTRDRSDEGGFKFPWESPSD